MTTCFLDLMTYKSHRQGKILYHIWSDLIVCLRLRFTDMWESRQKLMTRTLGLKQLNNSWGKANITTLPFARESNEFSQFLWLALMLTVNSYSFWCTCLANGQVKINQLQKLFLNISVLSPLFTSTSARIINTASFIRSLELKRKRQPYAIVYTDHEDEQRNINTKEAEKDETLKWWVHFCYNLSNVSTSINSLSEMVTVVSAIEIVYYQVLTVINFCEFDKVRPLDRERSICWRQSSRGRKFKWYGERARSGMLNRVKSLQRIIWPGRRDWIK